jgi:ribose transport system substrate-binding protein
MNSSTLASRTLRTSLGAMSAIVLAVGVASAAGATTPPGSGGGTSEGRNSEWFDQEQFDAQLAARDATPEGPEGEPWLQSIDPTMVDTSEYAADGPYELCFSNTDVGNPWRQVGWTTMQEEVALHPEIETFTVRDAGGSEEKQIADIAELVDSGSCDVLIVSPASTAALTPAIEDACTSLPVIVFDRGVETDCPVTFIHPAGGYLFGADAAEFLVDNVEPGGNIVALRILPGVDVLETRWVAGQIIMEEAGLNILAAEFTDGDAAKVKSILQDLIDRGEQIDGVWMDAGATSVAAIEAFEENGLDVPPITGEDQQDFLIKWQEEDLTAVAPTYPTYQWRTPILASLMLLNGEQLPGGEWLLPQPVITAETRDSFIDPTMPPLFYAMCGCQDMPNFPEAWQS